MAEAEDTIQSLIDKGEGQFLEFKSIWDRSGPAPKRRDPQQVAKGVAETLDAMANADGGTVLLGVEDYKDISGVDYSQETVDQFSFIPQRYFRHSVSVRFEKILAGEQLVLKFDIDSSPIPVQLTDGRYLYRIGEHDIPYPAEDIAKLKAAKVKAFYEREFVYGATLSDLDESLLKDFLSRIGETRESLDVLHQPYRLIDFQNGAVRLTKVALLLFGKDPLKWHPRCDIDFVKYEGTKRKTGAELNIIKRIKIQAPLVRLIDEAFKAIRVHIKERTVLHDLFFKEKFEYPTFAWQEALINAVAHRDYSLEGISIEVEMFDDRLEIKSPGRLPEAVSISSLLKRELVHFSRNPLLVRVFTDMGYMREKGEGIPRMFDEMEKNYLQAPELKEESFSFRVTLKNIPIFDEDTQRWLEKFSKYPLSQRQKRVLAHGHQRGDSFTSRLYQKVAQVDRDTAYREVQQMRSMGIVSTSQEKYSRNYLISEPTKVEPISRGLLEISWLVKEKGYITNADIRKVFNLSRVAAWAKAKELVSAGYLKAIGKGRGARYISTPKLQELEKSRSR